MTPLTLEFDLTKSDMLAYADALADNDLSVRKARRQQQRVFAALAVLVGLFGLLVSIVADWVLPVAVYFLLLPAPLLAILLTARNRMRKLVRRSVRVQLTSPAGRAYLGRRKLEVSADGLNVTTEWAATRFQWRAVHDQIRSPGHLFLVLPGPAYLAIPRRAFEYDEDFNRFVDAVTHLCEAGGGLAGRQPPP